MSESKRKPDFIFETSWEICNKVGGINTVISTKVPILNDQFKNNLVFIGPDIWREASQNVDFEEDKSLFKTWRKAAFEDGLRLRIGRWKIEQNPIVILVDYTPFISQKNELFKHFWETHRLDSLNGSHDYVEAAMFGYAAGKTIESFWNYHLSPGDKVVAHFHEWMTGTGVLYLDLNVPHISTLFTTHATVVGRSLAGNGMPLYQNLQEYNGDAMARELNIQARQSLEKTAAHSSDAFTTVSEITAKECSQLLEKDVDVVTPNGFDDSFVPPEKDFPEYRGKARNKFREVAEALLGYQLDEDAMMLAISGRYEFRNKGIDVFVSVMDKLNRAENLEKEIVAFVLVPANNYGPRRDLMEKLNSGSDEALETGYLTHGLHDDAYDAILNSIKNTSVTNSQEDRVKVIYVPSYLDGEDGIFNMRYYDLLIGLDMTLFPSYYEPWGYTPLESLAFRVPTITTNLAGIGMWITDVMKNNNPGIEVFDRRETEYDALVSNIVKRIADYTGKSDKEMQEARENAHDVSRIALWKNLIKHYYTAYDIALKKIDESPERRSEYRPVKQPLSEIIYKSNKPVWKGLVVEVNLPEKYKGLDMISRNLWWTWNHEARELFAYIDPELWKARHYNPIRLLKEVRYERLEELENDRTFQKKYQDVYKNFEEYVNKKPVADEPSIAYFSMEYGLNNNLKIYSGGLGILAGDYLKEASDVNYDMVGVGLFFKYGYFTQQLSVRGEQMVSYEPQNFSDLPLEMVKDKNGNALTIQVAFPGRNVYARIWRVMIGRVPLLLLDTDIETNRDEDRGISHQLYGGDNEHRLKQEMLLGIGGVRALTAMGIEKELYHINEGHAALLGLERLRKLIVDNNYTFDESLEIVRSSTLFTTHTPVPAGHDSFDKDLVMVYMGHYPERLNVEFSRFMNLGRWHPGNKEEKFSMSVLAANIAQEMNGVSKLHGDVTQSMFNNLWDGYFAEELHVGYVTNGVHLNTWIDKDVRDFYVDKLGKQFLDDQSNPEQWHSIYDVPDQDLWDLRNKKRKELIGYMREKLNSHWTNRHVNPKTIVQVRNNLDENALTIGFARRFATYKRAYLLFKDLERLSRIVNNENRPVQFVFAGKAHPADGSGQDMIKYIVNISNRPEFLGKVVFLENYDMEMASFLVKGVDIWLNTPTRPLEASGTSGMKGIMNGVINFSVLDGWWIEGYQEDAGWSLPMEKQYDNQDFQDELDAESIYSILEHDIIPKFYKHDDNGLPGEWLKYIKNSIANIAPEFTTKRMIDDYYNRFYKKLYQRVKKMRKKEYELARRISNWKKRVLHGWDAVVPVELDFPDTPDQVLISGEKYKGRLVLDLKSLSDKDVGVEVVITENQEEQNAKLLEKFEMKKTHVDGSLVTFEVDLVPPQPGTFSYAIRVYPYHKDLPHRQDFPYVKWI